MFELTAKIEEVVKVKSKTKKAPGGVIRDLTATHSDEPKSPLKGFEAMAINPKAERKAPRNPKMTFKRVILVLIEKSKRLVITPSNGTRTTPTPKKL